MSYLPAARQNVARGKWAQSGSRSSTESNLMCGIAGIVAGGSGAVTADRIRHMTDAMAHRGPDAEGLWIHETVALGHRRLSIIDLSTEANQPFLDHSGRYAIVFNGEIYNFKQIRQELVDYPFRTNGDTEVLLAAFIRWGEACLDRLFGMFAFAVWDTVEHRLFVARDRLGIKPLYFHQAPGLFLFASEIRSILASGLVRREIDRLGLCDYLSYQTVHAPRTIIANIAQLMPGECGVWERGAFVKKTYWDLSTGGSAPPLAAAYRDYDTVKQNVRRLLHEAVERRLVSDVPLGAFLSGGIDSSAIVALMAQTAGRPVDTFSINFKEPQFDESAYSGLVAGRYKTRHHPLLLESRDFLDALPDALRAMDAPSGDGVNTYVVSKVTKQAGVTVALSGLGGDELFAGYSNFARYQRLRGMPLFWSIPRTIRGPLVRIASLLLASHQKDRFLEIATAPSSAIEDLYPAFRKLLTGNVIGEMLSGPDGRVRDVVRELLGEHREAIAKLPFLSQVSVAEISTYTQNVLLRDTDQMSMAHALEVRVPFFDHALVEYVLHVPDQWKEPTYPKKLLVESLRPLVPDEVVHRPKRGFELPWKVWLKTDLREFCEDRLVRFAERGLVDPAMPRTLWRDFLSGKNDRLWSRVWILVVLEEWLERNLDSID
jgi:asparagine synthase (glutamine-hydrolysing)